MLDLIVSILDGHHEFRLQQIVKGGQVKVLVQQFVVYFSRDAHETDGLAAYLSDNGLPVRVAAPSHASGQVLGGNQIGNEELSKLARQYVRLFVEDGSKVVVVFLSGHPDLHVFNHMGLGGIVEP